ncbi:MAG TPA: peptide chain release factor N(5)-glutamine methyltransferase [Candidatus Eisenbacteria bacterium]|nr:peptide chain release factor N(5)-glutamine methyltransferase [Candidatus Eisenbacteria bacterium]
MTVLQVIQRSTEFLAKKGVDSPRLQAELLLAHLLKLPRMQLYLNFERALTPAEEDGLRELIKRRGQREPLQHIIGSVSFCGYEIAVNRHVLIPRPDTELLAARGWEYLSTLNHQPSTAFDWGTGSACIAIALACKIPTLRVYATDSSPEALELAQRNAASNGVADRIQFLSGSGFSALPNGIKFDLIISNPPYIPTAEISLLQPEVRDHDPRQALDGGPDGLDHIRQIAAQASAFLKPSGKVMLEFGDGQAESVRQLFSEQKWIVEDIVEDYTQRPRIFIGKRPA